jgi:hypothetical protein
VDGRVVSSDVLYLFAFHAYINKMHVSRSKIPSKKIIHRQRSAEGFNSSVKGLRWAGHVSSHAKWETYTKFWLENKQLGLKTVNRFNWLESQLS